MRKRWRVGAAIVLGLALIGGAWVFSGHLYPAPSPWDGIWENETRIVSLEPGELRVVISPEGVVDIRFDRQKYDVWWIKDRCYLRRLSRDIAELRFAPDRDDGEGDVVTIRIEVRAGRMTVSNPEPPDPPRPARPGDVMVFRRVLVP